MRKHRLKNRIKSIVGSLIDPDKDEELKDTNLETEDNYNKILELLKDENQQDKNKLAGLIEDFHTRYQSIYQRYDNITGKLKEKVRSKKEKEEFSSSSSSSSDSDSDSNKKESKNGKVEKVEIEAANREIEELNRKLKAETEEKEALNSQYQSALNKIQETENMFNESKLQSHRLHEEKTHLNSIIEAMNIEKMETIEQLRATEAENKSLSEKVSELSDEIKRLEMKIEEAKEEIENGVRSKEQIVDELEDTIEDLKTDLEIKGEEVNTLTETVRNLEVKIRLSNQKLRITEQLLHETEHNHATKEQKLHQQNKTLIEKISTLSETINFMKTEIQETLKGFDLLTVKFEEDYGHVMTRVCEIRNEVKAVEIQARVNRSNNEYLREKVEERVMELSGSLEDVKGRILEKEEKIKELEDVICVKDEEILWVCEDKREAIRQLCAWGDYQRDRCDGLLEALKPVVDGGRRRQTVR